MKLFFFSFLLSYLTIFAGQQCVFEDIGLRPISAEVTYQDILLNSENISVASGSFRGVGSSFDLDLSLDSSINMLPVIVFDVFIWECKFDNAVKKQNLEVTYVLVGSDNSSNLLIHSSKNSSLVVKVINSSVDLFAENHKVRGWIKLKVDLSNTKYAGLYTGMLKVHVKER